MIPQYAADLARMAAAGQVRPNIHYTAALNVEKVRSYMETHLGCTAREIAYALNISYDQARNSVRKIRSEWVGRK